MDYELRKACERGECEEALQLIKSSGWRDEFAVLGPDEALFDRAVRWRDGEYDGWRSPDDPILDGEPGEPPVPKWCLWLPLVQLFDDAGAPLPRGAWKVRWSDGTEIETPRSDVRICHTAHARLNTEGLPATPLILACAALGLPVVTAGRLELARALLALDTPSREDTQWYGAGAASQLVQIHSISSDDGTTSRPRRRHRTDEFEGKNGLVPGGRGQFSPARAAASCAGCRCGSPDAFRSDATDDGVRTRRLSDYGDPPAPRSGRRREPDVHWAITL